MITGPDPSLIDKSGLIITAEDQRCFLCGEATADPCVMWSGSPRTSSFTRNAPLK
jgi:hypothetical protein